MTHKPLVPMELDSQLQLMNIYGTESKRSSTYNNFPSPCERGLCEKTRQPFQNDSTLNTSFWILYTYLMR